ncbi:hypothetical protein S7711_04534, partial [Stachybotrys chartarum IBT 7711]
AHIPLQLILSLYEPNTPDYIARTQSTLSRLQTSPQAWLLARHLLGRPDEKVKFFGALTIIIKINTERCVTGLALDSSPVHPNSHSHSAALSDDDATELLLSLVGWYLDAIAQGTSPLVSKKLSSALATFFLRYHQLWPRYICHLIFCFTSHQICRPDLVDPSLDIATIAQKLEPQKIQAILWVATTVAEDATKVDMNTATNMGLYETLLRHISDPVALIRSGMSTTGSLPTQEDSIRCLQAWVWFSQKAATRDSRVLESLRPLVAATIEILPHDGLYDVSAELLADILSNYSSLLSQDHFDMLASLFDSEWSNQRYQNLLEGDFGFEAYRFGQLLLAFGDARVQVLMQAHNESSQRLLSKLCGLLAANGHVVAEDNIFVPTLEFWSTFAETMTDAMYSEENTSDSWTAAAGSHILQAVSNTWRKIAYPSHSEFSQWDSSDRAGFHDARKDVVDFMQSAFTIIGPRLVFTFAELLLTHLSTSEWPLMEAAAFCLAGLADCVRDETHCDEALASVFASPLFSVLQAGQAEIPVRVRQTCVSLIEHYNDYFERHVADLPGAVRLLFKMVGDNAMAAAASKSIMRLCSSCRHHLHPEVEAFIEQYRGLVSGKQLDCTSSEKVIGAISCVVQAMPDRSRAIIVCEEILSFIQDDLSCAKELLESPDTTKLPCSSRSHCAADTPDEHPALHAGLRALRCLSNVAKGMQSPPERSIDLEDEALDRSAPSPEMTRLQHKIIRVIVDAQGAFSRSAEVTELICSILRSGFAETEPGPFVLRPEDVAQYLMRHKPDTPRIGVFVSTACSFASSLYVQRLEEEKTILSSIILWVIGLAKQLTNPEADPELTQNCIDFVTRILAKRPASLLHLQPPDAAEFFFYYTLQVLDGKEPLPKAAAAEFWAVFVNLKNEDVGGADTLRQAMDMLGPLLSQSLARNIGGNASRSELDKLSEPLKRLVSRYPQSKDWISSGLVHSSFPSDKVTDEQKSLFVKKLVSFYSLRGSRATNQVVRDFWLSARGSNFAYAS